MIFNDVEGRPGELSMIPMNVVSYVCEDGYTAFKAGSDGDSFSFYRISRKA